MKESFKKVNDYTLGVHLQEESEHGEYMSGKAKLSRYFNFLSCQVTTLFREHLVESGNDSLAGMGALSSQLQTQNFSDIQSPEEIKLMHKKLIELNGKPPALDDILPGITKPAPALRPQTT